MCNYHLIGQSNFHSVPTKALDVANGVYHYLIIGPNSINIANRYT